MFEKITDVPEAIREFYQVETRSVQQFNDDETPVMQEVEYSSFDEEGNPVTAYRMEPVFADTDFVVEKPRGECRSLEDVWDVVHKHHGERDDLIKRFLSMACNSNQWMFHDEYLAWYQRGLELEAVVLPEPVEGEPDPLPAHQERIARHEAQEPVKPPLIDVEQWFYDNYSDLREAAYPPKDKQFEMQYDDLKNGTNHWIGAIEAIKAQYPKLPA